MNGRPIKNAARTAHSLAVGRGEMVGFRHFVETLDALDEFTTQFEAVRDRHWMVSRYFNDHDHVLYVSTSV